MLIFQGFLYAIIGYIIGGILFSLIIGKVFLKVDIRVQGSGNAGATNLGRIAGAKRGGTFAIIGGTLDLAKGFIAIFINALLFRYAFNNDGNEFAS
jgi:glycerol-3-phosphate acyltransferase PlsY